MIPVQIELDHATLQVDEAQLQDLLRRVIEGEGGRVESLSVVLTDHETVLSLNQAYLAHDYLTDVLSFNLGEGEDPLVIDGEVYVDLDTAQERCEEFGASFEQEVYRYVVHGVLHLFGYDDQSPEGKVQMHALEDAYLTTDRQPPTADRQ